MAAAPPTNKMSIPILVDGHLAVGPAIVAGQPANAADIAYSVADVDYRTGQLQASIVPGLNTIIANAQAHESEVRVAYVDAVHGNPGINAVPTAIANLSTTMNDMRVTIRASTGNTLIIRGGNTPNIPELEEQLYPVPREEPGSAAIPIGTVPGYMGSQNAHAVFPKNLTELQGLTNAQLNALEAFYGIPFARGAAVQSRRQRFTLFIMGA